MGHIKGLTNVDIELNPQYGEPWLIAIGRYILNFGSIELVSYKFLDFLEDTEDDFLKNTSKLLSQRISRIEELVEQKQVEQKHQIFELWAKARELSIWRNRIAHNPVLPTWKTGNDSKNSPPNLLGIPDMRQITKDSKISDSISLDGLNILNDATVEIAEQLHQISTQITKT